MSSVYVGTNRADTLNSLATWLIKGPSVAFLEGAPGTGKTALASELRTSETAQELFRARIGHEVYDSEKPVFREVLAEIAGQLSVEGLTAMSEVLESHTSIDVGRALERALRQPVLIVIDEAQRFLNRLTQEPDEEFARALSRLRQRETRGRLLLISDRRFPREEIWAEWLLPHTLTKLSSSEARELFELRLRERGIVLDIATERISKILFDLDHNPRAIQTLVGALIESSIDEIIEDAPELWATADRVVSSDFLSKLERNLLEKTLKRIRPEHSRNIRMLSVHRRGVKRQALDKLCKGKEAGQQVVRILTSRFLANLSGVLSLNPIVREICLERLRDSANELKEAHSAAAEFYGRKFKAENMVGSDRELGIDFAELRYHLFNSGEFAKLGSVAHRFIRRVQSLIEKASPPANREDLDERIGLLSSLPEADRSIEIEYHLAQCLRARSSSDDLQKALQRVEEAIGPYSPPKVLHLLLQLSRELRGNEIALSVLKQALAQWKYSDASLYIAGAECVLATGGRPAAVAFLREGIARIGPDTSAVQLYQKAADLLYEGGNTDDAIEMMREGICCLSTEASSGLHLHAASFLLTLGRLSEALEFLHSAIAVAPIADCYNSATGLLFKHGHYEQALDLLKIGIAKISREESALSLYLNAAQHLAANEQQPQALALLREVITTTSANSAPLYLKTADLLVRLGSPRDAIDLARRGIPLVALSNRWELYFKAAELLSQFDDIDEAINLLKKGMEEVPPSHGLFSLYHSCGELLAIDRVDEAINLLKEGIAKTPPSQGLFSLYHSCGELLANANRVDEGINLLKEGMTRLLPNRALYQCCGELLAQAGRVDEGINLLKEGIAKILPSQGLSTLYQSCGELLARAGRVDEGINLLKEGIAKILPSQGLSALYQSCGELLAKANRVDEGINLLKESMTRLLPNRALYQCCGELLAQAGRVDEGINLLKEGIAKILPSQGLFALYQCCGELLAQGGRVDEGINLLKEGIAKILPSQGLSTLYQSCGELLAQAGRVDESINLLKEGIAKILPSHGLSTLYQSYGELLAQADRVDEAINLLKEGMKTILPSQGLSVIYQTCEGIMAHSASHRGNVPALLKEGIDRINDNYGGKSLAESLLRHIAAVDDRALLGETVASIATRPNGGELKELAHVLELQIQNEWKQAAEQATEACLRYPHSFALMQQAAFSWLCEEAPERAEEAIALYSGIVRERQNSSIEWIRAFIADAKDDNKQAVKHLSLYRGRPLTHEEERASVVQQLIQLWLDQNDRSFGLGLSSLFPILPPSLTGLRKPLNRYGVCNVQPEDFTAPVAGGLDDNIRSALGTVYFDRRLNDADYQASFKSAGMEKAESVLQRFSEVPRESQCRYAYLSIGGADGSEIEWAMKRSSINKGLLLEYGTAAAASARKRISNLAKAGKTLLVIEGDAVQKLSEVSEALNAWKQAGYIDGIVVSAQSVLHELPYRSAGFSLSVFLGQLFKGWDNIFFYCREPCGPQGWPEVVQLRLKNVTGDALAGMARHIKAHLNFDGDVHSITDDFVEMPSNLALETLFKVLYLDSTFTYEMGEKLTAFDPEHVGKVLERYIGSNSVQIEYTVSDHFKREYQRTVDSVVDIQKQISLRMPNSFVRITASKRKS